jgi:hypothetical protein
VRYDSRCWAAHAPRCWRTCGSGWARPCPRRRSAGCPASGSGRGGSGNCARAGWDIECLGSGADAPYRLSADRLDESVAGSDDLIARIKVGKPKERLIEYLVHVSPWLVSGTRLREVARSETWRDDLQALRDEGWPIQTHGDDPAIPPGYFRLARLGD